LSEPFLLNIILTL